MDRHTAGRGADLLSSGGRGRSPDAGADPNDDPAAARPHPGGNRCAVYKSGNTGRLPPEPIGGALPRKYETADRSRKYEGAYGFDRRPAV